MLLKTERRVTHELLSEHLTHSCDEEKKSYALKIPPEKSMQSNGRKESLHVHWVSYPPVEKREERKMLPLCQKPNEEEVRKQASG
jgi:hypothetical protein